MARTAIRNGAGGGMLATLAGLVAIGILSASGSHAADRFINEPRVHGLRIDWCQYWAHGCGQGGADNYCRHEGFDGAADFQADYYLGSKGVPTLVLGDGRFCMHATCTGLRWVTCTKR